MRRVGLLLVAAIACVSSQVMAYTINVDFAPKIDTTPQVGSNIYTVPYSGTGAAPDTGTVWNALAANNTGANNYDFQDPGVGLFDFAENGFASYSNLLDSLGNSTPVGISFDAGGVFAISNTAGNLNNVATNAKDMMREYLIAFAPGVSNRPGQRTVTLSGLPAGQQVNLWLYGEGDQNLPNRQTAFDANGVLGTTVGVLAGMPLTEGPHYVALNNVFANGSGEIVIKYAAGPDVPEGPFNGFQLTFVPEPASAALLGLAAIGMLAIRRKW